MPASAAWLQIRGVGYPPCVTREPPARNPPLGLLRTRNSECPKRMVFGPCGGVRHDLRCEVDDRRCPFIEEPAPRFPIATGSTEAPGSSHPVATRLILCDFRPTRPTIGDARLLARRYAGWADTILLGDHHETVDLPSVLLASIAIEEGVRPWVTLSCRDRNAVALEADLAALAELGVAGVHCVTGDARAPHVRKHSTAVFDLDSLRLTALARSFGLTVSVAESPDAPPTAERPARVLDKYHAGASWCVLNVGSDRARLEWFIATARHLGAAMQFAACVPVFTDAEGAERLQRLPGVSLDPVSVRAVLGSTDPVSAGISRAVQLATSLLSLPGVDGINLSGPASTKGEAERASVMREITSRLR